MKPRFVCPTVAFSILAFVCLPQFQGSAYGQALGLDNLARLTPGRTKAENALWIENPLTARFNSTNRVVVADISGPAMITMIHFALPNSHFGTPIKPLGRDLLLRMYWDSETTPSVEVPLVDFFCDTAGHARGSQQRAGQQAPRLERLLSNALPQVGPR